MSKQCVIDVVADWVELGGPTLMGRLTVTPARAKEVFAFEYDGEWLSNAPRQALDPAMALYGGPQYPAKNRETFGVFLDSSPDRWGRVLMRRREAHNSGGPWQRATPSLVRHRTECVLRFE